MLDRRGSRVAIARDDIEVEQQGEGKVQRKENIRKGGKKKRRKKANGQSERGSKEMKKWIELEKREGGTEWK